jgi:geranylgeranyl transferase type-2 subunit beta
MLPYLGQLTLRLAAGLAELPAAFRQRHAAYLLAAQQPDGGFAGRQGGSDLYYTSFGLRALSVLGELYGPPAERAARFLAERLEGRETVVDLLSLIYGATLLEVSAGIDVFAGARSDWQAAVAATLEKLRRSDGGYAKAVEGHASSTYQSFLVLLCLQLIDRPLSDPAGLIAFVHAQRGEDGGFREIRVSKRSGTNPTAAAIGSLRILDALRNDVQQGASRFLAEMQTDEGGLRANTRIPIADLLSTLTGIVTLADLEALAEIDTQAASNFVRGLERPDGGFHAAVWDDAHDVEYTFYGLGCQALLALH